jgi:hypothetical protein
MYFLFPNFILPVKPQPSCMKKLYIPFCFLLISHISLAQLSKGLILSGTDNGLSFAPYHTVGYVQQSIFGMAIKDNLVLGIDFYLGTWYSQGPLSTLETNYGVGVYLRKYVNLGGRFSFFGQSRLGLGSDLMSTNHPNTYTPYQEEDNGLTLNLGLSPGFAYTLNSISMVEIVFPNLLSLNYGHTSENNLLPPGTHLNPHQYSNGLDLTSSLSETPVNFAAGVIFTFEHHRRKSAQ